MKTKTDSTWHLIEKYVYKKKICKIKLLEFICLRKIVPKHTTYT